MTGRNAPCPCGSGKKFKYCCIAGAAAAPPGAVTARAANDAASAFSRGVTLLNLNRHEEAMPWFQRALAANPRLVQAHNNLGIALKNLGRWPEAVAAYGAALAVDRAYAPAQFNLGDALNRQGLTTEARACYERALSLEPDLHGARLNLGNLLCDLGDFDAAIREYRRLIEAGWDPPRSFASLGTCLMTAGRTHEGMQCFATAASLAPDSAEAHFNLARAQLQCGDPQCTLESLQRAIQIKPLFPSAELLGATALAYMGEWQRAAARGRKAVGAEQSLPQIYYRLATTLLSCGLHERALACFRKVLDIDPEQPTALHFVAALSGANPDHSHPAYVRQLFDDAAAHFDQQLVDRLHYTAPAELAELTRQFAALPAPWDILDLGCGTGLFGAAITAQRRRLVGVDLSARMLQQARALGIYDALVQADIAQSLAAEPPQVYDLIVAVDVFIYLGKLEQLVELVMRALRPGGLFAFSAEALAQQSAQNSSAAGYQLQATGRYAHQRAYLLALAQRHGFKVKCMRDTSLRLENARAVPGWLTIWSA